MRRHLHAHPELSWHEHQTQTFLRTFLQEHGVQTRDCAGTGLVADFGQGPRLALYRGDIDALPIAEIKANPPAYVSQNEGVSHACGHDVHATIAATIAVALHRMSDRLPGRVRVILQPAEEVLPSGAERMIAEGVAEGVDAAFAVHMDPARLVGTVGLRSGPLTSATDSFSIIVRGQSGHSARPYLSRDAILASADIIRALYGVISQVVDPMLPAVLNVGTIHGGQARNVIAGEVHLEGVVRSLHPEVREALHTEMRRVIEHSAAALGCTAEFTLQIGAGPVQNDPDLMTYVQSAAEQVLGAENVHPIEHPSAGAEDFGMFADHTKQFMLRVGSRREGAATHHLHTPEFDPDERALSIAPRIMGRAVLASLLAPG